MPIAYRVRRAYTPFTPPRDNRRKQMTYTEILAGTATGIVLAYLLLVALS